MSVEAKRWIAVLAIVSPSLGCRSATKASPNPTQQPTSYKPASGGQIQFAEDDFSAARDRAISEHVPLFVDAWAPWCHTCLAMRSSVFGDPALSAVARKFVWAAIDTERPENAAFTKQFPMQAWPTLFVIDPRSNALLFKWEGSLTAPELVTLLESAVREPNDADAEWSARAAWIRGNRAAAEGNYNGAIEAYEAALHGTRAGGPDFSRLVEALISAQNNAGQKQACFDLASLQWSSLPKGTSRLNVVVTGLSCGDSLGLHQNTRKRMEPLLDEAQRMATDRSEPILADDRSSLWEEIVDVLRSFGEEGAAMAAAMKWRDFLEEEAVRAATPNDRVVFDSHRMLAYAACGQPERAIPMLEQSERDFPDDYDPPARLAKVYLDLGKLQDAYGAVTRAEKKVYGPRTMRVLSLKADILSSMKKPGDAQKALRDAVAVGEKLDVRGGYRDLLDQIRKRAAKSDPRVGL